MERKHLLYSAAVVGALALAESAFTIRTRKEIGKEQGWVCQGDVEGMGGCYWEKTNGKPASYSDGYWVTAAHYPDKHQFTGKGYHDKNKENGRILCTNCHAIEEIQRGNNEGASKMLSMGTFHWNEAKKRGQLFFSVEQLSLVGV